MFNEITAQLRPLNTHYFVGGQCTHPECFVLKGGRFKIIEFPNLFVLFEHESGYVLFDTGYSQEFFKQTQKFPASIYRYTTPVKIDPSQTALAQLECAKIKPEQIKKIIISHFHADHISALKDFPKAQFICFEEAFLPLKNLSTLRSLKNAFLPGLLPSDFEERWHPIRAGSSQKEGALCPQNEWQQFFKQHFSSSCYDVLGDQSILALKFFGHCDAQMALVFRDQKGPVILLADSVWLNRQFKNEPNAAKANVLTALVQKDFSVYQKTEKILAEFHQKFPEVLMVPSHCQNSISQLLNRP